MMGGVPVDRHLRDQFGQILFRDYYDEHGNIDPHFVGTPVNQPTQKTEPEPVPVSAGFSYFKDGHMSHHFETWQEWIIYHDAMRQADNDMVLKHFDAMQENIEKELVPAIAKFIKAQLTPLVQRIEQLESTLGEFGYRGTWREGIVYRAGNFVTHSGSLWHCNSEETTERPNTNTNFWTIAAKRGRDAPRQPTAPTVGA